jgi:hypothetical protein
MTCILGSVRPPTCRLTTRGIGHRLPPDHLARPARRNAIPTISGRDEDLEHTREEASALKRGSVHRGELSLTVGRLIVERKSNHHKRKRSDPASTDIGITVEVIPCRNRHAACRVGHNGEVPNASNVISTFQTRLTMSPQSDAQPRFLIKGCKRLSGGVHAQKIVALDLVGMSRSPHEESFANAIHCGVW